MDEQEVDPFAEARMSVFEHLAELRRRVGWAVLGIAILFVFAWTWVEPIFEFLRIPLSNATEFPELAEMHHRDLAEPFFVMLKTAMFGALFLGAPWIILQVWLFVAPALYDNEKKLALPFSILAAIFFYTGAAFCFFVVMPLGYEFLLAFSENISTPELMMNEYLGLTTKFVIAFGLIFEMPVVAMFLSGIGVLTHRHLLKYWRYAIIVAFVIGGILTPPDPVTQTLMAVPLCVLYFVSVGVAWVFTTRRERRLAEEEAALEQLG